VLGQRAVYVNSVGLGASCVRHIGQAAAKREMSLSTGFLEGFQGFPETIPFKDSTKNVTIASKKLTFLFAFPVLSGKFGKPSLRFRAAITFFFVLSQDIPCFPEQCATLRTPWAHFDNRVNQPCISKKIPYRAYREAAREVGQLKSR
jgi:hypothetical protein